MRIKILEDVPAKGLVKGSEVEVRDDAARHLIARKQAKEIKAQAEPEAVKPPPAPAKVQTTADMPKPGVRPAPQEAQQEAKPERAEKR